MVPDLTDAPPGPDEPWDPASGLLLAQATHCYRRALELNPKEPGALASLSFVFRGRRMDDAMQSLAIPLDRERGTEDATGQDGPPAQLELPPSAGLVDRADLSSAIAELLHRGRAETAVRMFEQAEKSGLKPPWAVRDRVAWTLLHLGWPAEARRVWDRAADAPSAAVRQVRTAAAALAAQDFPAAASLYRGALQVDPRSVEARFGLALLHTQLGDGAEAAATARECRRLPISPSELLFLRGVESLAAPRGVSSSRNGS